MKMTDMDMKIKSAFKLVKRDVTLLIIWNVLLSTAVLYLLWVKFP